MSHFKSFAERQADQARAKKKLAERLKLIAKRHEEKCQSIDERSRLAEQEEVKAQPHVPWKQVRFQGSSFRYFDGTSNKEVFAQPWTRELVDAVLDAAESGGNHLFLVWPLELGRLTLLHGISSLQRNFATDLRGLRTLLYPGSHATRLALQSLRVGRDGLTTLYRNGWSTTSRGTEFSACTRSASYEALLAALNEIEIWNNPTSNPPLGALIPCFIYEDGSSGWKSSSRNQLELAVGKVQRLGNRRDLLEQVAPGWTDVGDAPGALFVMHNETTKRTWKSAFAVEEFMGEGRPECLLLDATMAAARSNFSAVHRIPEFIRLSRESALAECGTVVVTDDPRTFLILRSKLADMHIDCRHHVRAAEGADTLFSPDPRSDDWQPALRSNANCKIGIVDRDAAGVAVKFQRLAKQIGKEEHPGHQLLMEASFFVMRLSSMPAGLRDLDDELSEQPQDGGHADRYSWANLVVRLRAAAESGILTGRRMQVEKAIECAQRLVSDWVESTPMAEKVLAHVQTHVADKAQLAIVLPNQSNIALARRFLGRRLAEDWEQIEARLEWHTLSSFSFRLSEDQRKRHYLVVGFNQSVMRLLLTHPDLPHGTGILLPYKQAEGALITLQGMKRIDALTPYRGRIGLLLQELERRLNELPPPPELTRAGEFVMAFDLSHGADTGATEQAHYRFELDGGGRLYASGLVYRYDIGEDGPAFRRIHAKDIVEGDLVFDMSEDLRSRLEEALHLTGNWTGGANYPERQLLKLYHDEVQARCAHLFPDANNRASLAKQILERMISENADASECRPERVQYWLDLDNGSDQRPHAPKEVKLFRMFCQAIGIDEGMAEHHWSYVRGARRLNQDLGRELSARYAEILFHPESAIAYRKVPPGFISRLQEEAVRNVYRVDRVVSPDEVGKEGESADVRQK